MLLFTGAHAQVNQYMVEVVSSKYVGKRTVMIQCDGSAAFFYDKYVSGDVTERVVLSDCVKEIEVSVWRTVVHNGDRRILLDTTQRYLTGDWVTLVITESTGAMKLW